MRGFRDVQWREQPAVLSLAGRIKLTRPSFHTEPIHTNAGRLASERVDREEARLPQVQQHLRRAYTRAVPSSHAAFGCHWPPLFKAIYMLVMLPLLSVDCHCLWIYRVILLPSLPFSAEAMAVPPPGLGAPRGCETIFSSSPPPGSAPSPAAPPLSAPTAARWESETGRIGQCTALYDRPSSPYQIH